MQRLGLNEVAKTLPPRAKEDLILAIVLLPLVCVDSRARVAALVVASDASEKGMAVVRTTSITFKGRQALSGVSESSSSCGRPTWVD